MSTLPVRGNDMRRILILLTLPLALGACDKFKDLDKNTLPAETPDNRCPASIPATGKEESTPDPGGASECFVAVLACSECNYDADGDYIGKSVSPCGVCVGSSTK